MLCSDFGSALMSGAQKSGALELVGIRLHRSSMMASQKITKGIIEHAAIIRKAKNVESDQKKSS